MSKITAVIAGKNACKQLQELAEFVPNIRNGHRVYSCSDKIRKMGTIKDIPLYLDLGLNPNKLMFNKRYKEDEGPTREDFEKQSGEDVVLL